MARAWMLLAFAVLAEAAAAQPLTVPVTEAPPAIDAVLDDACWRHAAVLGEFTPPGSDELPLEPTEARLCRDGTWLYVSFACHESRPAEIVREQTAHDGPVNLDDSVEILIAPVADRSRYYHFLLSANNTRAEQQGWPGRTPYRGWDTGWRSATAVTDGGWVAEIALPLVMLSGADDQWHLNLCRNKRTAPAQYSCVAPVVRLFNELDVFLPMAPLGPGAPAFAPLLTEPQVSGYREGERGWGYEVRVCAQNQAGQAGRLELRVIDEPTRADPSTITVPVALGAKDDRELSVFVPVSMPSDRAVTLRLVDPQSGELRQWLTVQDTTALSPLSAWLDRSYYSVEDGARVVCQVRAPEAELAGWSLQVRAAAGPVLARADDLRGGEQMLELPLAGIALGEHALSVVLSDAEGREVSRRQMTLARLEPRPGEVKIDRVRQVALVDGEPFFPLGFMATEARDVPEYAEAGFNMVSSFAVPYLPATGETPSTIADAALASGLKYIDYLPRYFLTPEGRTLRNAGIDMSNPEFPAAVRDCAERCLPSVFDALRSHSAMLAYYGIDEPFGDIAREGCRTVYDAAHRLDPHHPVYVLFSAWVPEEPGWEDTMDLVGVDPYMVMGEPEPTAIRNTLSFMATCTDMARRFADEMHTTLWIVPQSEYYSGSLRPLLPEEQMCQTFMALIYGGRGLLYFRNPVYHQASWENFGELTRRVRALMPALLTRQPAQTVEYLPEHARRFDYPLVHACLLVEPDGTPVILAANTEPRPAQVRFALQGLADGLTVRRMFAEVSLTTRGGGFEETIEAYGVRAYRLVGHRLGAGEARLSVTVGGAALAGLAPPAPPTMPPPERNLIANGELEGPEGWELLPGGGAGNAPAQIDFPERGDEPGRCLHITRDNDFSNAAILSDWITLAPHTRYRYGCEMRGTIARGTGRIAMMMIGRDGHGVADLPGLTLQAGAEQWQSLSRTVTTGNEPVELRVWLSLYRVGGEGWWDNVFLEEVGEAPDARNLLANASFEHAVLPGWPDMWWPPQRVSPRIGAQGAQWTQDFDEAWHGECSLRTICREGQVPRPYSTTRNAPEAVPGKAYTFSMYMKADQPGRRAVLRVGDSSQRFELSTDWQRYQVTGRFGADGLGRPERIWVSWYCEDPGTYWADAAQCELGPEATEWTPDLFPGAVGR
ncbi:MAG: hypothetical protein AB7Y46_02730 [Armatimonadota bacterium]